MMDNFKADIPFYMFEVLEQKKEEDRMPHGTVETLLVISSALDLTTANGHLLSVTSDEAAAPIHTRLLCY